MSKTCRFSTSIFSPFGLDFGGSWAPKMEPSWVLRPQKIVGKLLLTLLKLSVLTKWRLGGLLARFWRPQNSILEGLGTILARFSHILAGFSSSGAVFATIFVDDALIAAGSPAWHLHWHFGSSLQRGGTCAAHPPPPEGRAVRAGH